MNSYDENRLLRRVPGKGRRARRRRRRLGPEQAGHGRRHLHRLKRPGRDLTGGLRPAVPPGGGLFRRRTPAQPVGHPGHRQPPPPFGRYLQPPPPDRHHRAGGRASGNPLPGRPAPLRAGGQHPGAGGPAAPLPLFRPPAALPLPEPPDPPQTGPGGGGFPGRTGLFKRRNPDALQIHPGRGPGLPGPQPGPPRQLLRPPPVPPDLQAAPDGRRDRPVLPDRPLLPGRGPPGRPPTGIYPGGHGDVLCGAGGYFWTSREPV